MSIVITGYIVDEMVYLSNIEHVLFRTDRFVLRQTVFYWLRLIKLRMSLENPVILCAKGTLGSVLDVFSALQHGK